MHWQWLLLDAHRGELFAITHDAKARFAPLTDAQLSTLTFDAITNDVVAETRMIWLAGDRLVMETQPTLPGEAVAELPVTRRRSEREPPIDARREPSGATRKDRARDTAERSRSR